MLLQHCYCWPCEQEAAQQRHLQLAGAGHYPQGSLAHATLTAKPPCSPASQVTKVLSKFEARAFIHTYVNSAAATAATNGTSGSTRSMRSKSSEAVVPDRLAGRAMLFELPRFQLRFELRCGALHSLDYAGYMLRPVQQLVWAAEAEDGGSSSCANATYYTLPGFSQYLVLQQAQQESSSGGSSAGQPQGLKVLVPQGAVQRGAVAVEHSQASDADLKVRRALAVDACA